MEVSRMAGMQKLVGVLQALVAEFCAVCSVRRCSAPAGSPYSLFAKADAAGRRNPGGRTLSAATVGLRERLSPPPT